MQPGPESQGDAPLAHSARSVSGRHARPTSDGIQALRLVGPYVIERELGRGSNGVVYLAHHPDRPAPVALKLLRVTKLDGEARARFEREGEVGRSLLGDPGVIGVVEAGEHQGRPWFAMEYCPGETLQARLQQGPLEPRAAAELVLELARTLSRAHARGIVHRDMKPGNVILDHGTRPRIADLGLARDLASAALTATGENLGTPLYMAPEQFEDSKRVDDRADVWALGVILYECLTGQRPYQESTVTAQAQALKHGGAPAPGKLRAGIDPRLDAICLAALSALPSRRPGAEALANELARFLGRPELVPTEVGSDSGQVPVAQLGARSPLSLVLLGGAGGLLLAGLIFGAVLLARPDPDRLDLTSLEPFEAALERARAVAAGEVDGAWGEAIAAAERQAAGDPAARRRVSDAVSEQVALIRARLQDGRPHAPALEGAARQAIERLGVDERGTQLELELGRWLAWRGLYEEARQVIGDLGYAPGERGDLAALVLAWSCLLEGARGAAGWHEVERVLEKRGESARADAARAVQAMGRNEPDRAVELAGRAMAAGPRDPEVLLVAGLVDVLRGPTARDVDPLVLERAPVDPRAGLVAALAAFRGGQADRVHEHLHRVMALLEGRGLAFGTLYMMGLRCRQTGHAFAIEPLLANALAGEGRALALLTRIARGLASGRKDQGDDLAAVLESLDDLVLHGRGFLVDEEMGSWLARQLGTDEGGGLLGWPPLPGCATGSDPALGARVGPADPAARPHLLTALVAASSGEPPHAVQAALERAQAAAPGDPVVALEAARLSVARDLVGAEVALARARELAPGEEAELDLLLGTAKARGGRPGAARAKLESLAGRDPHGALGLTAAAELALLDGEWRQALVRADRALAKAPELLPARVARICALVALDPRQADREIAEAIERRCGYAEARLVGAGAELAARAQLYSLAVTLRPQETELHTLDRRAAMLKKVSEGTWVQELEARLSLFVAPWSDAPAQMHTRALEAIELGLQRTGERADLELARGLAAISAHEAAKCAPPAPEPCLEAWSRALRAEPALILPASYAHRFAAFYPRHALVLAWRRERMDRRPFAAFLADRLRSGG